MQQNFTQSVHCTSRAHCKACRSDEAFRQSLITTFGVFECPLGLPIGASVEQITDKGGMPKISPPMPIDTSCRRRSATAVRKETRPCCGGRTTQVDIFYCETKDKEIDITACYRCTVREKPDGQT